jgi:hypothetical protein
MRAKKIFNNLDLTNKGGLALMGASLLFICANIFSSVVFGVLAFVLFLFGGVYRLLSCVWFGKNFWQRFVFGVPLLLMGPVILLELLYFAGMLFGQGMSFVVLVFVLAVFFFLPQGKCLLPTVRHGFFVWDVFLALSLFGSLLLLGLFAFARTGESIISPWNSFHGEPFVLFGLVVCCFLIGAVKSRDDRFVFPGMVLVLAALSVSALLYKIGFGFDPFLHRAAEEALLNEGIIYPKQFLYSGQYLFVAWVSQLTQVRLYWVDVWLVPVFASVWLPPALYLGLWKGWKIPARFARVLWLSLFLIPYQLLTFTVPFTVTFVLFVGFVALLPLAAKNRTAALWLFVANAVGCLFHPLLAVPVGTFLGVLLLRHFVKKGPLWAWMSGAMILVLCGVPGLLWVYNLGTGQTVVFWSLVQNMPLFTHLWRSPYWDPYPFIPAWLQFIYGVRYVIPLVVATEVFVWMLYRWRKQKFIWFDVFWVGVLGCIYAISTLFHFKDIIAHEQLEFALRLLQAWFVCALVPFAFFLSVLMRHRVGLWIVVTVFSLVLVHAWYFSYPQYNLKYPFYSPGVGQNDIAAVRFIEGNSDEGAYLVLSNQMVSAAAIQAYGFAQYYPLAGEQVLWYAIPTGGPLYVNYSVLIEGGFTQERCDDLIEETGVVSVYAVVPSYYEFTIPQIMTELREMAVETIQLDLLLIYKFNHSL